jgi:hypothetical protein
LVGSTFDAPLRYIVHRYYNAKESVMQQELERFFDDYLNSWTKGPDAIAQCYSEPCMTARNGALRVNPSRSDTASLFAEVDRQYRSRGYTQGERLSLDWKSLGANCALATIRWSYQSPSGETLWETTFSYNLIKQNGDWKIYVQTMHD